MESPKDITSEILLMCQYLTKYLPNFSDKIIVLRNLMKKKQPLQWIELEELKFTQIKHALTRTPLLRYFDESKSATIQCDASKDGLCGTLLQQDQPVVSRVTSANDNGTKSMRK